jgi:hypothetical protein
VQTDFGEEVAASRYRPLFLGRLWVDRIRDSRMIDLKHTEVHMPGPAAHCSSEAEEDRQASSCPDTEMHSG